MGRKIHGLTSDGYTHQARIRFTLVHMHEEADVVSDAGFAAFVHGGLSLGFSSRCYWVTSAGSSLSGWVDQAPVGLEMLQGLRVFADQFIQSRQVVMGVGKR